MTDPVEFLLGSEDVLHLVMIKGSELRPSVVKSRVIGFGISNGPIGLIDAEHKTQQRFSLERVRNRHTQGINDGGGEVDVLDESIDPPNGKFKRSSDDEGDMNGWFVDKEAMLFFAVVSERFPVITRHDDQTAVV